MFFSFLNVAYSTIYTKFHPALKNAGLLFCMFVHALYWNARKTIKSFWGQWCPSGEKSNTIRGCPRSTMVAGGSIWVKGHPLEYLFVQITKYLFFIKSTPLILIPSTSKFLGPTKYPQTWKQ